MRQENLFKAALISACILLFIWPRSFTLAGEMEGVVKSADGKGIPGVALLLYDVINEKEKPQFTISEKKGEFHFCVMDQPRLYRVVAYCDGKTWEKPVTYRGQSADVDITVGEKWYETKWADRSWTFLTMLLTFFVGLFSREVGEWVRKQKVQRTIVSMYEKSILDFLNEYSKTKDITQYDESTYSAFYAKFVRLKENIKSLSSYAWAAEKIHPEFFKEIQDRLSSIHEMETTIPFDKKEKYTDKLIFLKKHHSEGNWPPHAKEHEQFQGLLNKLRKRFE